MGARSELTTHHCRPSGFRLEQSPKWRLRRGDDRPVVADHCRIRLPVTHHSSVQLLPGVVTGNRRPSRDTQVFRRKVSNTAVPAVGLDWASGKTEP